MPTCKNFCNKVFLPDKERVEIKFAKKHKVNYVPINKLPKEKKSLKRLLKKVYLATCKKVYCQKKCDNGTNQWLKSYTKKRKERLIKQGATSGCRDLMKEFPGYYTL
jgi:hypothetical protein